MCPDCPDTSTCCGASEIALDSAVSSCMQSLGIQQNRPVSEAISNLATAICDLQEQIDTNITCEDMKVSATYSNIGFTGTPTTTACNLFTAINTRFGNILDWEGSLSCLAVSSTVTTINEALQDVVDTLCRDLYTTDQQIFLPIAGNSDANLQQSIYMGAGEFLFWKDGAGAQITGFGSNNSFGLIMTGGSNPSSHLNPIDMESPVKLFFANRVDFSLLTAGTTNLDQDTMKPLYIIDKTSVNTVNLPSISTLNVTNPVVTFSAKLLGTTAVNCKIYAFAGQTINGAASYSFGLSTNSITILGSGSNWTIIQREVF